MLSSETALFGRDAKGRVLYGHGRPLTPPSRLADLALALWLLPLVLVAAVFVVIFCVTVGNWSKK